MCTQFGTLQSTLNYVRNVKIVTKGNFNYMHLLLPLFQRQSEIKMKQVPRFIKPQTL